MTATMTQCLLRLVEEDYKLSDYQSDIAMRWCAGCGDSGILTAIQRLCRDEKLPPEKTVFVSGIGCSSRLPHYMNAYGFHGMHGRALPVAEGIKLRRPDLHVFVTTGDGDCCSIGAAHWIHAIRYNMNMTVLLHDNQVYGLTKNQASPTSPRGLQTNTTPRGAYLDPLNPLSVTLGVANVSFVAQAVDWIPGLLYDIIARPIATEVCRSCASCNAAPSSWITSTTTRCATPRRPASWCMATGSASAPRSRAFTATRRPTTRSI